MGFVLEVEIPYSLPMIENNGRVQDKTIPATLAMLRPTPNVAYVKDIVAAIIERNHSLLKFGI